MELNLRFPKQKTTSFLFVGTVLFIGSAYINSLKEHSADWGIYLSGTTIFISLIAQCVNWWIYWGKKDKQEFKVEEIKVLLSGKER